MCVKCKPGSGSLVYGRQITLPCANPARGQKAGIDGLPGHRCRVMDLDLLVLAENAVRSDIGWSARIVQRG
jgi:hypothetical protein